VQARSGPSPPLAPGVVGSDGAVRLPKPMSFATLHGRGRSRWTSLLALGSQVMVEGTLPCSPAPRARRPSSPPAEKTRRRGCADTVRVCPFLFLATRHNPAHVVGMSFMEKPDETFSRSPRAWHCVGSDRCVRVGID
jgi:hypothetical protein